MMAAVMGFFSVGCHNQNTDQTPSETTDRAVNTTTAVSNFNEIVSSTAASADNSALTTGQTERAATLSESTVASGSETEETSVKQTIPKELIDDLDKYTPEPPEETTETKPSVPTFDNDGNEKL